MAPSVAEVIDRSGRVSPFVLAGAGRRILETLRRDDQESVALQDELDEGSIFEGIVGASAALQAVLSQVAKVAQTDATVLLTGETGTGQELIARAIHRRSQRSVRPIVASTAQSRVTHRHGVVRPREGVRSRELGDVSALPGRGGRTPSWTIGGFR